MKIISIMIILSFVCGSLTLADTPVPVSHWDFQAVNSDGSSSFTSTGPWQVILEGILLNNPEQWLDPTPDPTVAPWYMGGEWEIYVQGEGDDHAGTACWIGQNYANGPGDDSYTNEEWLAEICRLNQDPNTAYTFHAGDRIRITGTYLFYAGKLNINENHETNPLFDFKIELIKPAVGLPQPEEIHISDLKNPDNTEIFDATRMSGCEYYQSRLVRIENVTITNPENWSPGNELTIQDSNGLTFQVLLGLGAGISRYDCPTGKIDVIGIMDQKAPGYPPNPRKGYRLLVLNYDGNKLVLGDRGNPRGNLPGDINKDYVVDLLDIAELAERWLQNTAGLYGSSQ